MCPNVKGKDVKVVFGDQFFTPEIVQSTGLSSAKLFYDHYHLGLNQEKSLGPWLSSKTNYALKAMMNAHNERAFNNLKGSLLLKYRSHPPLVNLLEIYSAMRANFLAYEIDSTPYTFKRRGSSPA